MKKNILYITGCSVFLLIILISPIYRVHADDFAGGDGSQQNPWQITTCEELQAIDSDVNYLDDYFIIENNIDCSQTASWNSDGNGGYYGFDPIGEYDGSNFISFEGHVDGNNKTIDGLYIHPLEDRFVGLFSTIASGATVDNLGVINSDVFGDYNVGALAGSLSGTVTGAYTTGEVSGTTHVGGLVGSHVENNSWWNSSPLVYTWNGTEYTYVADVGNLIPKEVGMPQDWATIDAKDLVPKGDVYSMRIVEEYNEIVYYDKLALMTYDHAPGYDIAIPLNRTAVVADARTVAEQPTNPLRSCVDMYGNDCTESLRAYDDAWSYQDPSFLNYWTLDFGDIANADSIQLVMRGAKSYAARQKLQDAGAYTAARTIQVKDTEGNWVEIYNKSDLGSDGTPRLRTVDLTGKFLSDDHRVRVGADTWNVNYFAIDTTPQVPVAIHTYTPRQADLGFHGFTTIDDTYYPYHTYDTASPYPQDLFVNQYGAFTKYGDVRPLLGQSDNHFVIMRPGDQLAVEFPYVAPVDGQERSFVLENDVYYKHASNDNIGLLGQTVDPLPYRGMTAYDSATVYPLTPDNQAYLRNWNTRVYAGTPKIVHRGGSTIIQSYSTADVLGVNQVGGLVGYNEKEIRESYATGSVEATNWAAGGLVGNNGDAGSVGWIHDSYATGDVQGSGSVGGLVGYNDARIDRSYATGDVTASSDRAGGLIGSAYCCHATNSSFSVGSVGGTTINIGGLIGYSGNATLDNMGWLTSTATDPIGSGGLVIYNETTDDNFKDKDFTLFTSDGMGAYDPWDFDTIWTNPCNSYPLLRIFSDESCSSTSSGSRSVQSSRMRGLYVNTPRPTAPSMTQLSLPSGLYRINMQSPHIETLQHLLNTAGFPVAITGPGSLGNETTLFGLKTQEAVKKFQAHHGFVADGVVGPVTLQALLGKK